MCFNMMTGIDPDCDCTTNNDGFYTPLHLAIIYYDTFLDSLDISLSNQLLQNSAHLKVVELLIEKG